MSDTELDAAVDRLVARGKAQDEQCARLKAQRDAETDPVKRIAYQLAELAGFDWYDTESSARRAFEHSAAEILAARYISQAEHEAIAGGAAALKILAGMVGMPGDFEMRRDFAVLREFRKRFLVKP